MVRRDADLLEQKRDVAPEVARRREAIHLYGVDLLNTKEVGRLLWRVDLHACLIIPRCSLGLSACQAPGLGSHTGSGTCSSLMLWLSLSYHKPAAAHHICAAACQQRQSFQQCTA